MSKILAIGVIMMIVVAALTYILCQLLRLKCEEELDRIELHRLIKSGECPKKR